MMLALIAAALGAAKSVFSWALSFFAKPPGSYVGVAALLLALVWIAHHAGYSAGQAACEAAHAVKVEQAVRRQQKAGVVVAARSEGRTNQNATTDKKAQEEVRYVTITAKTQPSADAECVPAALADRVRDIH